MNSPRPSGAPKTRCDPMTNWAAYIADLIRPQEREPTVVVVVAHPDDEAIGVGAQLSRFRDVFIIHITDGAPRSMNDARACGFSKREDYAKARRIESERAMVLAGVPRDRLLAVDYIDQEASLNLVELSGALAKIFCDLKPGIVLTHPYEGGHPDHDATAFAVHAARRMLADYGVPLPILVEMPFYHSQTGTRTTSEFIQFPDCPVSTARLLPQQILLKRKMFECYATQKNVLKTFSPGMERFRPAPNYNFQRPPHEGKLFYENFDWGMTGLRWRDLARLAEGLLGIQ